MNAFYIGIKLWKQQQPKVFSPQDRFVFIIDEINRADLSRVFGELMYGLEYRDKKFDTQYSYLSGEQFSIPKNVYIIGTMNDIDRSVESMDFALRRRFAWHEITAEDSMAILDENKKAKEKMEAINKYIGPWKGIDNSPLPLTVNENGKTVSLNLGKEYQLGGAYFKKIDNYPKNNDKPDWEALWDNHIEGILREYLRGRRDIEEILNALKNEYNKAGDPQAGKA